jgi:hypothetical protein
MKPRAGQREFELGVERHRLTGLLARRQYGKTTIASRLALKKMMKLPGHTVIFGSVKLDLGREIVRKEADALQRAVALLVHDGVKLELAEAGRSKPLPAGLTADDFADVYEGQRLEFRLYHSRSVYSRTKVVALTPAAVGETGDLILDEVGRVKNFRDVWESVKPIIASQPAFRCVLTTTPPPDDTHYSFDLLAPPVGAELPVNPRGNWYRSELGVQVLRVTAWDAYADGIPLYDDDTGAAISPEESRARDHDKDAWDRNYGCRFVLGGTAAVGLLVLDTAQQRGVGQCACIQVDDDAGFDRALLWYAGHTDPTATVGIGADLATTEKATSNPTAVAIVERRGIEFLVRMVLTWKTRDSALAQERMRRVVDAVRRGDGPRPRPARKLCVDATNERYFADDLAMKLQALVPVDQVIASERFERPGHEPMTVKTWLGSQLVGELEDNHVTLPPERYLREDFRLVKKEKGLFTCEPDVNGRHGDTFDAVKLALHALLGSGGPMAWRPAGGGGPARGERALRGHPADTRKGAVL